MVMGVEGRLSIEERTPQENYLELFEKWLQEIHEGTFPQKGLKYKGRPEQKEVCEDVAVKNREQGIFLVADGVSKMSGWFASRETAKVVSLLLGEELNRAIANIEEDALIPSKHARAIERMNVYVATQMIAAIEQANTRIKAWGVKEREFKNSATTLSLGKLVTFPDGNGGMIRRLFFTNVGDSRMYIRRRGGELKRITRDDNLLEGHVDKGNITSQEADIIDQTPSSSLLNEKLRPYAHARSGITKAIGIGDPTDNLKILYADLEVGDQLVIVSDGISDQMPTKAIQETIDGEIDDTRREEALQRKAFEISFSGTDPLSKPDDISAVVFTVV